MDRSLCPDVERIPGKVSGEWIVKGTRVQADAVLDNATDGFDADEIADDIFDGMPVERVRGILAFARAHGFRPA